MHDYDYEVDRVMDTAINTPLLGTFSAFPNYVADILKKR